jgi:hypothetical protein
MDVEEWYILPYAWVRGWGVKTIYTSSSLLANGPTINHGKVYGPHMPAIPHIDRLFVHFCQPFSAYFFTYSHVVHSCKGIPFSFFTVR